MMEESKKRLQSVYNSVSLFTPILRL